MSIQAANHSVNGRRGITPATALRLAKFFDTTPYFWLNLQMRWDLYEAQREQRNELAQVVPHRATAPAVAAVQESGPAWETDQESNSAG